MENKTVDNEGSGGASKLTRRTFLGGCAALSAAGLSTQEQSPNVLFITSDQFHHAAFGAAGNPIVKTPNLDRLAAAGARFTQSLAVTPFCSPTRASWLTGLYPHVHGITFNVRDPDRGVNDKFETTEHDLQKRGYTCRQFGKWHLGERARLSPYRDQPAILGGKPVNRTGGVDRKRVAVKMIGAVERARAEAREVANAQIGRIDTSPEESAESIVADDAIQAIHELAGSPFMITVSLSAPHAPWQIGEPYYSMYPRDKIELPANRHSFEPADKGTAARVFGEALGEQGLREYVAIHYAMISMVDWNIGRLLDALDAAGLSENTLVIFTSDHGDMLAGHGMYGKSTFSMYEETTRVPLLLRLPRRIPQGRVVHTQSGSCDIRPTILDYLDIRSPSRTHGVSLRRYIDGDEDPSRPMFAERERGAKHFQRLIRTQEWKYVYSSDGRSQLYHLSQDPGETKNLARDPEFEAIRTRLRARLRRWMEETGDTRVLAES